MKRIYYKTDATGDLFESCKFHPGAKIGSVHCTRDCLYRDSHGYSNGSSWIDCKLEEKKEPEKSCLNCELNYVLSGIVKCSFSMELAKGGRFIKDIFCCYWKKIEEKPAPKSQCHVLHEIKEVYIGMDGCVLNTPIENYLYDRIKEMYDIACENVDCEGAEQFDLDPEYNK